jgi:hypothetical protein
MKSGIEIGRVQAHNDAQNAEKEIAEKIAEATDEHFRKVY